MPDLMPKIPTPAETQLGSFFAAKDIVDRRPGGSKKKWPLVVAGILLTLVIALFVGLYLTSGQSNEMPEVDGHMPPTASQQVPAE